MDEETLRNFAIEACGQMLDAFYDSGFNPANNWNEYFINIYDMLCLQHKKQLKQ